MKMFCILTVLLFLVSTACGTTVVNQKETMLSIPDFVACLARTNAVKDNTEPECKMHCFFEVTGWLKDYKFSMEKFREALQLPEKVYGNVERDCTTIKVIQNCHWINQVYDCVKTFVNVPARSEFYKIVSKLPYEADELNVDVIIDPED